MIQLSISVRNAVLVRKGLQDLEAEAPKIGRQQIRTVMERIKRRMQEYPPEPEGQSIAEPHPTLGTVYRTAKGRYHRTGLLGASWAIENTQDNNGYKITNTAARRGRPYAKYVVGNAYGTEQAYMHRAGYVGPDGKSRVGWQLLRDVAEQEAQKLPEEITRKIFLVARRKGLTPEGEKIA